MLKRPLFPVATALSAGILASGVLGLPPALALLILAFAACASIVVKRRVFAILCAVAALGLLRYQQFTTIPKDDISTMAGAPVEAVAGRVVADPDVREDRAMVTLAASAVAVDGRALPVRGKLLLTCYRSPDDPGWRPPEYGDVIRADCRVRVPNDSTSETGFSWKRHLARQGIYSVAYVREQADIHVIRHRTGNAFAWWAIRARQGLQRSIYANLPGDEASVVVGMDLGTYTTLPQRLLDNFSRTGTLHLLAASGFNCAVIVFLFGFIFWRMFGIPRRYANPAIIATLIFYMLMVGAKPSIVRATVMAVLFLLATIVRRPADVLNLLFGAAVVILAINPADLFDVGFQLSFAAVAALVMILPVIEAVAERWRVDKALPRRKMRWMDRLTLSVTRNVWEGFSATTAATLGTLPLSAYYFNQLSLVSVFVNAVVALAVLPIFVIGLALPVVSHIPLLGTAVSWAGTAITGTSLSVINWFGELPFSCLSVPSPGAAGVAGYYILLAVGVNVAASRVPQKPRKTGS